MAMLKDYLGEQHFKEISEELGNFIEQTKEIGWKDLKSWSEFFGVFKVPQWNIKHLEQRVTTNFLHYRSNYALICSMVALLQILFNPFVLLALICVVSFCIYLLVLVKKPILIGDFTIQGTGKFYLCAVVSVLFLAISGAMEQILWICIYCLLVCVLHMVFRPRSVTSKTNKVYEELKLNGFSWFGGGTDTTGEFGSPDLLLDPENPPSPSRDTGHMTSASVRKRVGPSGNGP